MYYINVISKLQSSSLGVALNFYPKQSEQSDQEGPKLPDNKNLHNKNLLVNDFNLAKTKALQRVKNSTRNNILVAAGVLGILTLTAAEITAIIALLEKYQGLEATNLLAQLNELGEFGKIVSDDITLGLTLGIGLPILIGLLVAVGKYMLSPSKAELLKNVYTSATKIYKGLESEIVELDSAFNKATETAAKESFLKLLGSDYSELMEAQIKIVKNSIDSFKKTTNGKIPLEFDALYKKVLKDLHDLTNKIGSALSAIPVPGGTGGIKPEEGIKKPKAQPEAGGTGETELGEKEAAAKIGGTGETELGGTELGETEAAAAAEAAEEEETNIGLANSILVSLDRTTENSKLTESFNGQKSIVENIVEKDTAKLLKLKSALSELKKIQSTKNDYDKNINDLKKSETKIIKSIANNHLTEVQKETYKDLTEKYNALIRDQKTLNTSLNELDTLIENTQKKIAEKDLAQLLFGKDASALSDLERSVLTTVTDYNKSVEKITSALNDAVTTFLTYEKTIESIGVKEVQKDLEKLITDLSAIKTEKVKIDADFHTFQNTAHDITADSLTKYKAFITYKTFEESKTKYEEIIKTVNVNTIDAQIKRAQEKIQSIKDVLIKKDFDLIKNKLDAVFQSIQKEEKSLKTLEEQNTTNLSDLNIKLQALKNDNKFKSLFIDLTEAEKKQIGPGLLSRISTAAYAAPSSVASTVASTASNIKSKLPTLPGTQIIKNVFDGVYNKLPTTPSFIKNKASSSSQPNAIEEKTPASNASNILEDDLKTLKNRFDLAKTHFDIASKASILDSIIDYIENIRKNDDLKSFDSTKLIKIDTFNENITLLKSQESLLTKAEFKDLVAEYLKEKNDKSASSVKYNSVKELLAPSLEKSTMIITDYNTKVTKKEEQIKTFKIKVKDFDELYAQCIQAKDAIDIFQSLSLEKIKDLFAGGPSTLSNLNSIIDQKIAAITSNNTPETNSLISSTIQAYTSTIFSRINGLDAMLDPGASFKSVSYIIQEVKESLISNTDYSNELIPEKKNLVDSISKLSAILDEIKPKLSTKTSKSLETAKVLENIQFINTYHEIVQDKANITDFNIDLDKKIKEITDYNVNPSNDKKDNEAAKYRSQELLDDLFSFLKEMNEGHDALEVRIQGGKEIFKNNIKISQDRLKIIKDFIGQIKSKIETINSKKQTIELSINKQALQELIASKDFQDQKLHINSADEVIKAAKTVKELNTLDTSIQTIEKFKLTEISQNIINDIKSKSDEYLLSSSFTEDVKKTEPYKTYSKLYSDNEKSLRTDSIEKLLKDARGRRIVILKAEVVRINTELDPTETKIKNEKDIDQLDASYKRVKTLVNNFLVINKYKDSLDAINDLEVRINKVAKNIEDIQGAHKQIEDTKNSFVSFCAAINDANKIIDAKTRNTASETEKTAVREKITILEEEKAKIAAIKEAWTKSEGYNSLNNALINNMLMVYNNYKSVDNKYSYAEFEQAAAALDQILANAKEIARDGKEIDLEEKDSNELTSTLNGYHEIVQGKKSLGELSKYLSSNSLVLNPEFKKLKTLIKTQKEGDSLGPDVKSALVRIVELKDVIDKKRKDLYANQTSFTWAKTAVSNGVLDALGYSTTNPDEKALNDYLEFFNACNEIEKEKNDVRNIGDEYQTISTEFKALVDKIGVPTTQEQLNEEVSLTSRVNQLQTQSTSIKDIIKNRIKYITQSNLFSFDDIIFFTKLSDKIQMDFTKLKEELNIENKKSIDKIILNKSESKIHSLSVKMTDHDSKVKTQRDLVTSFTSANPDISTLDDSILALTNLYTNYDNLLTDIQNEIKIINDAHKELDKRNDLKISPEYNTYNENYKKIVNGVSDFFMQKNKEHIDSILQDAKKLKTTVVVASTSAGGGSTLNTSAGGTLTATNGTKQKKKKMKTSIPVVTSTTPPDPTVVTTPVVTTPDPTVVASTSGATSTVLSKPEKTEEEKKKYFDAQKALSDTFYPSDYSDIGKKNIDSKTVNRRVNFLILTKARIFVESYGSINSYDYTESINQLLKDLEKGLRPKNLTLNDTEPESYFVQKIITHNILNAVTTNNALSLEVTEAQKKVLDKILEPIVNIAMEIKAGFDRTNGLSDKKDDLKNIKLLEKLLPFLQYYNNNKALVTATTNPPVNNLSDVSVQELERKQVIVMSILEEFKAKSPSIIP